MDSSPWASPHRSGQPLRSLPLFFIASQQLMKLSTYAVRRWSSVPFLSACSKRRSFSSSRPRCLCWGFGYCADQLVRSAQHLTTAAGRR